MLLTPYLGSVCNAACACQEGTPTKISCDLSWPPVPINGNLNVMSIAVHSQSLSKSFPCINHHMTNLQNQNIIESARAGRCKKKSRLSGSSSSNTVNFGWGSSLFMQVEFVLGLKRCSSQNLGDSFGLLPFFEFERMYDNAVIKMFTFICSCFS